MISNYELQQYFLDEIKEFSISNPDKTIDEDFIYSQLIRFNVRNDQRPNFEIGSEFPNWINRYLNNPKINVFQAPGRNHFLWFQNGQIKGNEIKLYIPIDFNHIKEGANQLFDFISSTNIEHQSKIARIIRNDNIVVRVNSLDDAKTIIDYVNSNPYLKEGLIKVNPFLPSCNGVGITMDNCYSYNSTVCQIISNFLNNLKRQNRLDLFTVDELNKYIKASMNNVYDLDLKDIYSLISKTTDPNFKLEDFVSHANHKLCDKYTSTRKRIIEPEFYFEQAVKVTSRVHPENPKTAILVYLKGDPRYFTNTERAREGLIKYVHPGDVISIMRTKLSENNIQIPNNDNELVEQYLNILLNKSMKKDMDDSFEFLRVAYINTMEAYNIEQSRYALKMFILEKKLSFFTNRFKDRDKLREKLLQSDIKRIILNNIDIGNLDINNISEIINRFEQSIGLNTKVNQSQL